MTWQRTAIFTDDLTLDFVKEYLKINYDDEDAQITLMIQASLDFVAKAVQKAIFNTAYTDLLPIEDVVPTDAVVTETDAPTAKPTIFYTTTAGVRTQYPAADILYGYVPAQRTITLEMTGDQPSVQENSYLEVQWSVLGQAPTLTKTARIQLIADWFENREASRSTQYTVASGVQSILSVNSLVM